MTENVDWRAEWLSDAGYLPLMDRQIARIRTSTDREALLSAGSSLEQSVALGDVLYQGSAYLVPILVGVLREREGTVRSIIYDALTQMRLAEPSTSREETGKDWFAIFVRELQAAVPHAWRDLDNPDFEVFRDALNFLATMDRDAPDLVRYLEKGRRECADPDRRREILDWLEG